MKELTLDSLGWCGWFEQQANNLCEGEKFVARVATVDRDQVLLVGVAENQRIREALLETSYRPEQGQSRAPP